MTRYFELKKATLLLLLIPVLFACNSETEETAPTPNPDPLEKAFANIPDQNFEQKLLAQGIDKDGVLNQQIWLEDALEVTSLDLFTSGDNKISDLTGIEAFKNLKDLVAGNNALTSVSLGENTALEKLHLSVNQLKTIDLSANTELTVLSIGRNQLEDIDLSANINLQYLSLEVNNLKTLDISNNTELENLNAIVNELHSVVGLEKTTKLKTLNLAWNNLEALDLSLPTLEGLNIENNFMKSLKIDGCTSLEFLLATQNELPTINTDTNQALKHLKVSYNQIGSLSLSNNPDLEILWASGNQLSNLDVSQSPGLYDLRIIRNQDLTCIKISSEQSIGTLQKENHQSLTTGSCE